MYTQPFTSGDTVSTGFWVINTVCTHNHIGSVYVYISSVYRVTSTTYMHTHPAILCDQQCMYTQPVTSGDTVSTRFRVINTVCSHNQPYWVISSVYGVTSTIYTHNQLRTLCDQQCMYTQPVISGDRYWVLSDHHCIHTQPDYWVIQQVLHTCTTTYVHMYTEINPP